MGLYEAVPRNGSTLVQKINTDPPPGTPAEQTRGDVVVCYPLASYGFTGAAADDAGVINDVLLRGTDVALIPRLQSGRPIPYTIYSPISIPSEGAIQGPRGGKHLSAGAVIQAAPTFAGLAMVVFPDGSSEQKLDGLVLDGTLMPAGTCDGIQASGIVVQYVDLGELLIIGAGLNNGLNLTASGGKNPNGWRWNRLVIRQVNGTGLLISQATDVNGALTQVIGCSGHGASISGSQNSKFTDFRADFSGDHGLIIQGNWTTGSGSGGMSIANLSTDRNGSNGVFFNAPTGNSPIVIGTLMTRRDGSSATGSGFAGVNVNNCALPVVIGNWTCYPGVEDNGTGNASPQYGLNLGAGANTLVQVSNAMLHAITAGINGSSGASFRNVWTRTGTTAAPTAPVLTPDTA